MSLSVLCPYPGCDNLLVAGTNLGVCVCKSREPIVFCKVCGVPGRMGASYCRGCRAEISAPVLSSSKVIRALSADDLGFAGKFRRPALACLGHLYAISVEGKLLSLSPSPAAEAVEVAQVPSGACGFNTGAIIETVPAPDRRAGWAFIAIHPEGLESVQLSSGIVTTIYTPEMGAKLVANSSEAESNMFRGVAANNQFCTFAERSNPAESVLVIHYFSSRRPTERPLTLDGSSLLGPVLCDGRIVMASEERVAVHDPQGPSTWDMPLPRRFVPLFKRSTRSLNVAPGSIPLTVSQSGLGPDVWIGGSAEGQFGLLHLNFKAKTSDFEAVPEGTSVSSNTDGTLCVCTGRDVKVLGGKTSANHSISVSAEQGMPAYLSKTFPDSENFLCYYSNNTKQDQHAIRVVDRKSAEVLAELSINDPKCNLNSCCGIVLMGQHILAQYLDIFASTGHYGLRFTHWAIEQ